MIANYPGPRNDSLGACKQHSCLDRTERCFPQGSVGTMDAYSTGPKEGKDIVIPSESHELVKKTFHRIIGDVYYSKDEMRRAVEKKIGFALAFNGHIELFWTLTLRNKYFGCD